MTNQFILEKTTYPIHFINKFQSLVGYTVLPKFEYFFYITFSIFFSKILFFNVTWAVIWFKNLTFSKFI